MSAVYVALIVVFGTIVTVSGPIILAWLLGRQARAAKLEDYARQDMVADRVTDAADKAADVAKQAAEAARLLVDSNAAAAAVAAKTAAEVSGKLEQIHVLVNSQYEGLLRDSLDSKEEVVVVLDEVMALNAAAGRAPSPQTLERKATTERQAAELRAVLEARHVQTAQQQHVEGANSGT